jgi:hypothetical protein
MKNSSFWLIFVGFALLPVSCKEKESFRPITPDNPVQTAPARLYIPVKNEVITKDYFRWVNGIVDSINTVWQTQLDEYVLVHANPWIMDSLRNTDYYHLKDRGIISKDPNIIPIIPKGALLWIPDSFEIARIRENLLNTRLDLNIPEFKLRILQGDSLIHEFPVRVGQNGKRYLAMAGREVDMRTQTGSGEIVRINRNAVFKNPKDNKRYIVTKRDDGVVTELPVTPWLEPAINGIRYGQMIHPTTNLNTLGKPYSNGCIGLRESDAWSVYFYAPLGTKIDIRYDLKNVVSDTTELHLHDVYPKKGKAL